MAALAQAILVSLPPGHQPQYAQFWPCGLRCLHGVLFQRFTPSAHSRVSEDGFRLNWCLDSPTEASMSHRRNSFWRRRPRGVAMTPRSPVTPVKSGQRHHSPRPVVTWQAVAVLAVIHGHSTWVIGPHGQPNTHDEPLVPHALQELLGLETSVSQQAHVKPPPNWRLKETILIHSE